jgi:hypothetical protein
VKRRILAIAFLTLAVIVMANQTAHSLPACVACNCKEYEAVRYGGKDQCLGANANGFVIIKHVWNPNNNGKRYAAVCDAGTPTVQTDTYNIYTIPGTAACDIGNNTVDDVLELATNDIGTVTRQPKVPQRKCVVQ